MDPTRRATRKAIDGQRRTTTSLTKLSGLPRGWITTVRFALGISQTILGKRLQMPKQRISQLETRERDGTIQLAQLRDVADAMDCDFAYVFVPRVPLEESVNARAREFALRELAAVERTMQLEGQETPIGEARIRDYIARYVDEKDIWRS